MGYAIADVLSGMGAEVFLISGPSQLAPPVQVQKFIAVNTADEMFNECIKLFAACDIAILSAAVADYKPDHKAGQKIKSGADDLTLTLKKNIDIAAHLGKLKNNRQMLVGFALETENALKNAVGKMKAKNFDFIVLNSLEDKSSGFGYDTNKITIIDSNNKITNFGLKKKSDVAIDIASYISDKLH
jgi:phosphopantothenoylcysteine decarboxylase / phosphopantothenate---cysteine ligase